MTIHRTDSINPKVILGIAAHPDDLDFSAAGSLAYWADQGADVYYLVLTDGSKGNDDHNITRDELVNIRRNEQENAAKIIGAKNVFFLQYPDAHLESSTELKKDITRFIRKIKPDLVVTTDPTLHYDRKYNFINHPDHRVAGEAVIDVAFLMARDRLIYPELLDEGLHPHNVSTLLLITIEDGNFIVDISTTIDRKRLALDAHKTQIKGLDELSYRMRGLDKTVGSKIGVDCAEAFNKIDMPS